MKGLVTIPGLDRVKIPAPAAGAPPPRPPQTNLPPVVVTPAPQKSAVVYRPVLRPVNKQAALVTAPNRNWLTQPAPDPRPLDPAKQIAELAAKLKEAQNEIGQLGARLGNARRLNKTLSARAQYLEQCLAVATAAAADLLLSNAELKRQLKCVEELIR